MGQQAGQGRPQTGTEVSLRLHTAPLSVFFLLDCKELFLSGGAAADLPRCPALRRLGPAPGRGSPRAGGWALAAVLPRESGVALGPVCVA